MPEGALGEHHPVGEDGPLVVDPVCIPVFKSEDTVGPLLELLFYLLVAAGRVADIEIALLVEGGRDRAAAEPGGAGCLDGEALRQGKSMGSDALLAAGCRCSQQEAGLL